MTHKSVLVTGCSAGGIGYALAEQFQKRGLTVFATARNCSKMDGLKNLPNTVLVPLDVTSPSDIDAAVAAVKAHTGGKLDYLVNNSGQSLHMPTLDQDIESAKDMFEVNFWGVFRMIKAFAPLLIEAKGTVVNIGSINGHLHPPFSGETHSTPYQYRRKLLNKFNRSV
jgi:1-acylglycerone phosphate reductase